MDSNNDDDDDDSMIMMMSNDDCRNEPFWSGSFVPVQLCVEDWKFNY